MSLTDQQIRGLLAACMAYDNRKPGEAAVTAWTEAAHRGRWTFHEALESLHSHYAESTEFLMPAHITARIKVMRQDEAMRQPVELPDPIGQKKLLELISGAFQAIGSSYDEESRQGRRSALAQRCPFCGASPGSECTRAGRKGPVPTSTHPSRMERVS